MLIIINGLSCTGKTTLGKAISERLGVPFLSRDSIKELIFDNLGWKDRKWSRKVGKASYRILYYVLEQLVCHDKTLIVETNFDHKLANPFFQEFQQKYKLDIVQILCKAEGNILFERFKKRTETDRHPGHVDRENYEEFKDVLMKGEFKPLEVKGKLFEIDTTDLSSIDFSEIIDYLKSKN